jgi:hypothetical protein
MVSRFVSRFVWPAPLGRLTWPRLLRGALVVVGLVALVSVSLAAHGGLARLFLCDGWGSHRVMARQLMKGTLRMHEGVLGIGFDEQFYNGAGFTNWGLGVPLLHLPFDALMRLGRRLHSYRFFPDRLTFFLYLAALIPLLWASLHRVWSARLPSRRRTVAGLLSWAATLAILVYGPGHFTSFHFVVYEETIAYFVVLQLYALSFYLFFTESKRVGWVVGMAVAAGFGLLVRPTGLPYVALWLALVAITGRQRRFVGWFAMASAPLVGFWLYSNWVRTGSLLSPGIENAHPGSAYQYAMQRFGSSCADTREGFRAATRTLAESLFVRVPDLPDKLSSCHYMLETRLEREPSLQIERYAPFLPRWAAPLLFASLVSLLRRPRFALRRLDLLAPLATFAALFAVYAAVGAGFMWRYTGDFLPALFLIAVQLATELRIAARPPTALWVAAGLVFLGTTELTQDTLRCVDSIATMTLAEASDHDRDLQRAESGPQPEIGSRIECNTRIPADVVRADGLGWNPQCTVDTFTNLYLRVPEHEQKEDRRYTLRFNVDHPLGPTLHTYVNGRVYTAHLDGNSYVAEVDIARRRMFEPVAMITIEWTRSPTPPDVRFLDITLS